MKLRNQSLAFCTMIMFGTAAFLGGCATTGMDRSVKTTGSIDDLEKEIRKIDIQIDATSLSLNALVTPGNTNLKKTFNKYSDEVEKLDDDGKRVIKRMDEMKEHSTEYFAEWQKQGAEYKNPEISQLSTERSMKLAQIYSRVPAAGAGIKSSFLKSLTTLKEIQSYLSNDLTPKGIETIDPVAKTAVQDLSTLKASLQPVIPALEEIKAELYTGKK